MAEKRAVIEQILMCISEIDFDPYGDNLHKRQFLMRYLSKSQFAIYQHHDGVRILLDDIRINKLKSLLCVLECLIYIAPDNRL